MTAWPPPRLAQTPNISLALRFSLASAGIAGAALIIIGTLFWTYTVRQVTDRETETLRLHAEYDASHAGAILDAVFSTMSTLAANSVLATALVDSAGKETYLIPFLRGFQHIGGVPIGIAFTDFEGGLIATNGAPEPSAEEQAWLKATLASGRRQATILPAAQNGRRVMLAAELLTYSRSQEPEGALLYRIPLEALVKDPERLVWGLENGPPPTDRLVVSVPLVTDTITAPLNLRYRISVNKADLVPSQTATIVSLLLATLAVIACVLMVSQFIARRLTRSLVALTEFSGSVIRDGLSDSRAEIGGPPEVASLAATLNVMLDRLVDVTGEIERKAWEESARQRSELLLSNASDGVHILEADGRLLTASKSFYQMLGYDPNAPPTLHVWDWDAQWSQEHLTQHALPHQLQEPQTFLTKHRRRDGTVFDVEIHSQGIELDGKRVLYASSRDISERKLAEAALRDSQEVATALMNATADAALLLDRDGVLLAANEELARRFGVQVSDLIGRIFFDFLPPELAESRRNVCRAVIDSGVPMSHPDERMGMILENRLYPVPSADGIIRRVAIHSRDITEKFRADQNIQRLLGRQTAILSNTPVGIAIIDLDQCFLEANQAFYKIFGWGSDEIIGRSTRILYDSESDCEHLSARIYPMITKGGVFRDEVQMRRRDGSDVWIRLVGRMVDVSNASLGVIWAFEDITDRKRNELALLHAQQQAEAANRAKSAFLANMSHEIRTPITSVMGVIDLLRRTNVNDEQATYLNVLAGATETLLTILNDILDISKIEAGKLSVESVEFMLPDTMDNIYSLVDGMATAKGLDLTLEGQEALPRAVVGDPVRLKQVLYNLTSNAIKFTQHGSVIIRTTILNKTKSATTIRFEIADTGIGMSSEQVARLFQPFSQADTSTTRRFGGTGLGLAISKRLVELMGGEIEVESAVGHGSLFRVTLPFVVVSEVAHAQHPDHIRIPVEPQPLRLLLAEDNPINQRLVRSMLQKMGHTVEVAANGKEAVAAVESGNFEAVLMDMQMPEMDGDEATRIIRMMPPPRGSVPIIALTADVMVEDRERYLKSGVNDLVPKPIDWDVLSVALATATSKGTA
ncbi:MAG: PAS domain S-box protein [Rhodospirillaceae bacterium]